MESMGTIQVSSHEAKRERNCWFHRHLLFLLSVLVLVTVAPTNALILQGGQRIAPRHCHSRTLSGLDMDNDGASYSLWNLPLVEAWAAHRKGLTEHHLKTLYRVAMRSNSNDWEEDLRKAQFPTVHLADLTSRFSLCSSKLVESRLSASGTSRRLVLEISSGKLIETVLIRHSNSSKSSYRYTVCVSSQVGCARACSFCATGALGMRGQLSSGEILEQVWIARKILGSEKHALRNVVFMGMGEPLDNWPAVHEACRGLTHQCLFGFGNRHVTISTVGASPNHIRKLAEEAPQVSLALSLHGATQALRDQLIPSSRPLEELETALDYHAERTGQSTMLEYLLIAGVNDTEEAVLALIRFCLARRKRPYVNFIPYNPTLAGANFDFQTPSDEKIQSINSRLRSEGIKSHVRWSSAAGRDNSGACGQLALQGFEKVR